MSGLEREALAKFAAFMDSSITYGNVENWWRDNGPKVRQILRDPASDTGHTREAPLAAEDAELQRTREALKYAHDRIKAALDTWNDDYGDGWEHAHAMRRILLEGQLVDVDRKITEANVFAIVAMDDHTPRSIETIVSTEGGRESIRRAVQRMLDDGRLVLNDDLRLRVAPAESIEEAPTTRLEESSTQPEGTGKRGDRHLGEISDDYSVFLMVKRQPMCHTPLTIEANPPKGVSSLRARRALDRLLADGRLVLDDDLSFLRTYGQPPSKRIVDQGGGRIEKEEAVHALVVASQNIERVLDFLTRDD